MSADPHAQAYLNELDLADETSAPSSSGPMVAESPTSRPVRDALGRFPPRNREGNRFGPKNRGNWKHGLRSRELRAGTLPEQHALAAIIREQVAQIVEELGGEDACSTIQRGLVQDWARLTLYAATVEQHLEQGGILTGKGATKAAANFWLSLLDRRLKLAKELGLTRVAKRLPTLEQLTALAASSTPPLVHAPAPDASAVPLPEEP